MTPGVAIFSSVHAAHSDIAQRCDSDFLFSLLQEWYTLDIRAHPCREQQARFAIHAYIYVYHSTVFSSDVFTPEKTEEQEAEGDKGVECKGVVEAR